MLYRVDVDGDGKVERVGLSEDVNNNARDMFDITNMFHWCPAPTFDSILLVFKSHSASTGTTNCFRNTPLLRLHEEANMKQI